LRGCHIALPPPPQHAQLLLSRPNSGSFDMITMNEMGPHKGRYLFTVFETGSSGVQRTNDRTIEITVP
jgi:hypothetical protein